MSNPSGSAPPATPPTNTSVGTARHSVLGSDQESQSGPVTPKYPASKDKECPFCDQLFTSSSLGRHLDLFIRQDNPKPPDGKHDIDQIRQMRSKITRRQPKTRESFDGSTHSSYLTRSGATRTPSVSTTSRGVAGPASASSSAPPTALSFSHTPHQHSQFQPLSAVSGLTPVTTGAGAPPSLPAALFRDRTSAAELALRELSDMITTVNAAPHPFQFDPFALTFPALVLNILPPPSTLFATSMIPNLSSWPINPPGQGHRDSVLEAISVRMRRHRAAGASAEDPTSAILSHVRNAFDQYVASPEDEQKRVWVIELMRALANTQSLFNTVSPYGLADTLINGTGSQLNSVGGLSATYGSSSTLGGGYGVLAAEALIARWACGSRASGPASATAISPAIPLPPAFGSATSRPTTTAATYSARAQSPAAPARHDPTSRPPPPPFSPATPTEAQRRTRKRMRDDPSAAAGAGDSSPAPATLPGIRPTTTGPSAAATPPLMTAAAAAQKPSAARQEALAADTAAHPASAAAAQHAQSQQFVPGSSGGPLRALEGGPAVDRTAKRPRPPLGRDGGSVAK